MFPARALVSALAVTLAAQTAGCSSALPPHGPYRSSGVVDLHSQNPGYQFPVKKYKLNALHRGGVIAADLVDCKTDPNGKPVKPMRLHVTIFDYQPFVQIQMDERTLLMTVRRAAPYRGTMYGLFEKWCPFPPGVDDLHRSAVDDNEVTLLPELQDLAQGQHDDGGESEESQLRGIEDYDYDSNHYQDNMNEVSEVHSPQTVYAKYKYRH